MKATSLHKSVYTGLEIQCSKFSSILQGTGLIHGRLTKHPNPLHYKEQMMFWAFITNSVERSFLECDQDLPNGKHAKRMEHWQKHDLLLLFK